MWFSTPSVSSIGQQQAHIFAPRGWIRGSSHTCHQTDIWTGSESSTAHLGHILYILMAKNGHTNLNTTQTATPRPSAPDSRISHADITFFGPSMRSHQWLYFFAHDSDSETGRLSLAACPGSRVVQVPPFEKHQVLPSPPFLKSQPGRKCHLGGSAAEQWGGPCPRCTMAAYGTQTVNSRTVVKCRKRCILHSCRLCELIHDLD